MTRARTLVLISVALLCAASAVEAGVYTIPVQPEQDLQWWHFYYFGADNGWEGPSSGSGSGASYYYDSPPAYRNHRGTYLGFDLPSLASGENVVSAELYFFVTEYAPFGDSGISAQLLDLGTLVGGTFNGWQTGTWLADIAPSANGWLGLNVTGTIQGAYGNSQVFQAFNVHPYGSGVGSSGLSFDPAKTGSQSGPYLKITTDGNEGGGEIPEPGTMILFLSGLAAAAASRYRRQAVARR